MSLHKYDGVLQFNRLVLRGFAAVATKWLVEYLQVRMWAQARACSGLVSLLCKCRVLTMHQ